MANATPVTMEGCILSKTILLLGATVMMVVIVEVDSVVVEEDLVGTLVASTLVASTLVASTLVVLVAVLVVKVRMHWRERMTVVFWTGAMALHHDPKI
tara:strand:+ start:396 stop:689 length:294 start_codon:yes stop_codon:yes gene_type:complete